MPTPATRPPADEAEPTPATGTRAPATGTTDPATPTPAPTTRRGQATRRTIVDGARRVFEAKGFVDARITDIARESGVATGSFYTYFPTKESVLAAVFAELQEEMLHPQLSRDGRHERVADVIAASHRAYLETYRENAQLMALREQVAAVDGVFREARRERSAEFVRRNARMITRLQGAGLADTRLDPELAASSLSGMVARAAYTAFVLGDATPMDELVEILTILWMNALGIPADAPAMSGSTPDESAGDAVTASQPIGVAATASQPTGDAATATESTGETAAEPIGDASTERPASQDPHPTRSDA